MKDYYQLIKPGIVMGNLMTAASGFALASTTSLNWPLLSLVLLGLGCVIASACAFNNYVDRSYDKQMERTQHRPLATGKISGKRALLFATILMILGSGILLYFTNLLATCMALAGCAIYVGLYTPLKYYTPSATLIGSIAGAMPPLVGYCAVTARLDLGAILLFLIVALWQMPHFYAIAMYRMADYKLVSIPVLPLKKGEHTTKVHMLSYICLFSLLVPMLTFLGYTGGYYLTGMLLLTSLWVFLALKGFKAPCNIRWARHMFRFSLLAITSLALGIFFNRAY